MLVPISNRQVQTALCALIAQFLAYVLLMTSVSWGLKQLLGIQKIIATQAFVSKK
jgi:hypothetical protein